MKRHILILTIIITFTVIITLFKINKTTKEYPSIELLGEQIITLYENDKFQEPGYKAIDSLDGNITNKVKIEGYLDTTKQGVYKLTYKVKNSQNFETTSNRIVKIIKREELTYKYDSIDNTIRNWGLKYNEHNRPTLDINETELEKYNAYAIGEDRKVLYLTFDEGGLESYLDEIIDILNANQVKGTFFLCKNYIKHNPDLINKIINDGHSIGNHTDSHPSTPTLATKENFSSFLKEIKNVEDTFYEITNKSMEKLYREPKGEFSLRTLSIMKDLGYKTYFWSAAYQDWDDSLTKDDALNNLLNRVHNGAIYLIHPNNKSNYQALDEFIKTMKAKDYTFDLVKNI